MDLARTLGNIRGLRSVTGDPALALLGRMGDIRPPKGQVKLYALDPAQALAGAYPDPAEALEVARRGGSQMLDAGVWGFGVPASVEGLANTEIPLYHYLRRKSLGGGAVGAFISRRPDESGGAMGKLVALAGRREPESVLESLLHEANHSLDPASYRQSDFVMPQGQVDTNLRDLIYAANQAGPAGGWTRYWGREPEVNATISRMRRDFSQGGLVRTPEMARDMLEANAFTALDSDDALAAGKIDDIRRVWTAQQLLNNPELMRKFLPAMTSALSVGAMVPAEDE